MINSVRSVRKAKGLTLEEVAARCKPATTAQTIGRLETGARTMSIGWLNRIAAALGVSSAELVRMPEESEHAVTALLSPDGAKAPRAPELLRPQRMGEDMIAVRVTAGVGDYRGGDLVWCRPVEDDAHATALNRDILVPRPAGRFVFGRLLGLDGDKLHLLPPGSGQRQVVVANPPWLAVSARLVREL